MDQEQYLSYVSYDAPPLDFSFKKIKKIEEILNLPPRQGERLNPIDELGKQIGTSQISTPDQIKTKNQEKPVEKSKKEIQENETKLIPERNINMVVDNMVKLSVMRNSRKNKSPEIGKKKRVEIKLICCSLILCHNQLRQIFSLTPSIQKVMPNFKNLQWLDISYNYLQTIDHDFKEYPHFKTLYIHCNYLSDWNEIRKLSEIKTLKTLTIHGNPIAEVQRFRDYAIYLLPGIKKLDSVLIGSGERSKSTQFANRIKKYPVPKFFKQPPEEQKVQEFEDDF